MQRKNTSGVLSENRAARFHYEILRRFEGGLQLTGSETKSCRIEHPNLKGAYVMLDKAGSAWLKNCDIPPYRFAKGQGHERRRNRRILLKKTELLEIKRAVEEKGTTAVPLNIHLKGPWVKIEIALGRGKKKWDKRETIKKRDLARELRRG